MTPITSGEVSGSIHFRNTEPYQMRICRLGVLGSTKLESLATRSHGMYLDRMLGWFPTHSVVPKSVVPNSVVPNSVVPKHREQ